MVLATATITLIIAAVTMALVVAATVVVIYGVARSSTCSQPTTTTKMPTNRVAQVRVAKAVAAHKGMASVVVRHDADDWMTQEVGVALAATNKAGPAKLDDTDDGVDDDAAAATAVRSATTANEHIRACTLHGMMIQNGIFESVGVSGGEEGKGRSPAASRWVPFRPLGERDVPNIFNPTITTDGYGLARADDGSNQVHGEWGYVAFKMLGPTGKWYGSTQPRRVKFAGDLKMARTRGTVTTTACVPEDLRFAVRHDHDNEAGDVCTPTRRLVTGSLMYSDRTSIGVFWWSAERPYTLTFHQEIVSPTDSQWEKNWIFIRQRGKQEVYRVLYDCWSIYQYDATARQMVPSVTPSVLMPHEWRHITRDHTDFRHSLAMYVPDRPDLLMVVLHTKHKHTFHYYTFCLFLDPATMRCTHYIPHRVLTDSGARIVFPTTAIVGPDRDTMLVAMGVGDRIAGAFVYSLAEWIGAAIPYDTDDHRPVESYSPLYCTLNDGHVALRKSKSESLLTDTYTLQLPGVPGRVHVRCPDVPSPMSSAGRRTAVVLACATRLDPLRGGRCYPMHTPDARRVQYVKSIHRWLRETPFDIIVVDGTGEFPMATGDLFLSRDTDELTDNERARLLYVVFDEDAINKRDMSSTPLEARSMRVMFDAIGRDRMTQRYDWLVKCTGKYFSPDLVDAYGTVVDQPAATMGLQWHPEPATSERDRDHSNCELFIAKTAIFAELYDAVPFLPNHENEVSLERHLQQKAIEVVERSGRDDSVVRLPRLRNAFLNLRGDCSVLRYL